MDLTTASPSEIDTQIFALLQAGWAAEDKQAQLTHSAHSAADDRKVYGWGRGQRQGVWQLSDVEVWTKVNEIAAQADSNYYVDRARKLVAGFEQTMTEISTAHSARLVLEAEYTRRGGWTRAYLVDNADGHVHKSTRCSSWNKGLYATRYHWLTELSGQAETEIVELAGERACTVCYLSAPVDVLKRPSKLEGPAQAAVREAKEARAAAKVERDAKKAAKAIANPDGSPLRGKHGVINTERTAWIELVDDIFYAKHYGYTEHPEINARIVAALAAKNNITAEAVVVEVNEKMAAKVKREGRG